VMNFPGVLNGQDDVMQKIAAAKKHRKPIDGHAPGLRGETAGRYIANGISTDHECFTLEEALEKLSYGMKILIREGSAARNFEALHPLLGSHPGMCMLCSDDMHPDELLLGHINRLVARAVAQGYDLFDVLHAACIHPVEHYRMQNGLLRIGDPADFIVLENLSDFRVKQTYIDGECVASEGTCVLAPISHNCINRFQERMVSEEEFSVKDEHNFIRIIEARDGQLITGEVHDRPKVESGFLVSDTERDILKMAVVNRYTDTKVSVGFIRNFGLRAGAIASTVAHDSHNIIVTGTSDREIAHAVNLLMKNQGGLCVVNKGEEHVLPLPVAGLMSDREAGFVGPQYAKLDALAKELGSELRAPFMTLSFMALLVIPQLKLSDLGLFDGGQFQLCSLHIE
jgi:adenine deaminase